MLSAREVGVRLLVSPSVPASNGGADGDREADDAKPERDSATEVGAPAEPPQSRGEVGRTIADYTGAQRLLFVLIGVQAALVEESLFRGYLQPTLMEKLGPMFGVVVDRARDALDGRGHGLNRGCGNARRRTMTPDDSCVACVSAGTLTRQSHRCGAHPAV
jgi:hypothetical protein